jgi:prepilin-type N-terminal cleavage/methylation domain-containing protein/prepilin-type processing-associated H-X9-DG protein
MRSPATLTARLPARGFTLIELLVVIAIIAILAGLLLPALASAKLRSQRLKCASNLKQMTLSAFMYLNDTGKMLPYYPFGPNGQPQLWMATLINYHAHVNAVRICPSALEKPPLQDTTTWGTADIAWAWASGTPTYRGSYAFNGWLYSGDDPYHNTAADAPKRFMRDTDMQQPTRTPVFVDSIWVDTWPQANDTPARNLYNGDQSGGIGSIGRNTIARHGGRSPARAPRTVAAGQPLAGGVNVGLADGHVEQLNLDQLWSLYWHRNYLPPAQRPN